MTEIETALNDIEVRESTKIAVLDIGSNSFHLIVVRIISGTVQILHKVKNKVRWVEGLSPDGDLSDEAMQKGLDALEVIARSIEGFDPDSVRIVATYTLRKAKNAHKFIKAARKILPIPIEIVSGQEEARLIYNGVSHTNSLQGKTLVVDIGGGSTEFALGEKHDPILLRSMDMGCVSYSQRFFSNGDLSKSAFKKAITAAQQELEKMEDQYKNIGWKSGFGTSGSIEMIAEIAAENNEVTTHKLTLKQLEKQMVTCIEAGHVEQLKLSEGHIARQTVYSAGLSILIAAFRSLNIEYLNFSDAALREGVIYEMDETEHRGDLKERSVQSLATRYDVDIKQANLVLETSFNFFDQVRQSCKLSNKRLKPILGWASLLHEIGLHIHSRGVQKHSGYILQHADLPGFNAEQQTFLAVISRFHRKKINLSDLPEFTLFSRDEILQTMVLLRLSVLLNIKRQAGFVPDIKLDVDDQTVTLTFPKQWLEHHPVIYADLELEQNYLDKIGFKLKLK